MIKKLQGVKLKMTYITGGKTLLTLYIINECKSLLTPHRLILSG